MSLEIITCPQWNAKRPKQGITTCGEAHRIIFHHTDSHHREISNPKDESLAEAIRFAQDIQAFHMGPSANHGWIDSGHNFLVTRAGHVLQGRWLTVSAIQAGHMVVSAHCPGQNEQIGIEHEHLPGEKMTPAQKQASALLQAWIADRYGKKTVLSVSPHSDFYATACPDSLKNQIPVVRALAQQFLTEKAF